MERFPSEERLEIIKQSERCQLLWECDKLAVRAIQARINGEDDSEAEYELEQMQEAWLEDTGEELL